MLEFCMKKNYDCKYYHGVDSREFNKQKTRSEQNFLLNTKELFIVKWAGISKQAPKGIKAKLPQASWVDREVCKCLQVTMSSNSSVSGSVWGESGFLCVLVISL